MKEAYFFSHDYNARQDPKMQEVLMDYGVAGIGIYWCIVEQLYEQGGRMALASIKAIAFALHVAQDDVRSIVMNYGLFDNDGTEFWSPSASRRLDERREIIEKRAKAATKRWSKNAKEADADANASKNDANAMQMHEKNDAMQCYIKESKVKEIKEKESNNNSLCIAQSATEEERERFLEIFTYEKNFPNPQQEVERFVAHYDATGWCRKDSTIPVKNKEALARMWKPQQAGSLYPDDIRQWLFETYYKAKTSAPSDAKHILKDITSVTMNVCSDGRHVVMICSKAAANALEKHYAFRPAWKLSYRIPN
jgi:hypothetical protein